MKIASTWYTRTLPCVPYRRLWVRRLCFDELSDESFLNRVCQERVASRYIQTWKDRRALESHPSAQFVANRLLRYKVLPCGNVGEIFPTFHTSRSRKRPSRSYLPLWYARGLCSTDLIQDIYIYIIYLPYVRGPM